MCCLSVVYYYCYIVNMNELKISLTNAFGIGKFEHKFDISSPNNVIMIYAPNGTMKTSLARTFLSLEEKHNPEDMIINSRKTSCSIKIDGEGILSEQIYVYKNKEIQIGEESLLKITDENIIPIISSPEKYNEFQELLKPLNIHLEKLNELFFRYVRDKRITFSEQLLQAYKKDGVLNIYEAICELYDECKIKKVNIPNTICYGDFLHRTSMKYIRDNKSLLRVKNRKGKPVGVNNEKRWRKIIEGVDNCESIRLNIEDDKSLIKVFLCSFAQREKSSIEIFVNTYIRIRSKLIEIINDINKYNPIWEKVISLFNSRYNVPYKLKIVNKPEVVLKHDSFIRLGYDYDDGIEKHQYLSEDHFLNFISSGEKRAYFLLLNLFGIEKRKNMPEKSFLVFDDIVESFDYKNKYAFVEYLADLKKEKNFVIILLTHNFDFFRTVHSRLNVKNVFMAERNKDRTIKLHIASYLRDIIKNKLIANICDSKFLISLVPFVRNIVEYTKGSESEEYIKLTSYVHVKRDTDELTIKGLFSIISSILHISKECRLDCDCNYIDKLIEDADNACNSNDDIALEKKLLLSIAIRILAEKFMIKELNRKAVVYDYKDNQTFKLFEQYEEEYSDQHEIITCLRKVIMMTSENIHLNNFMFEPIIDLSCSYLKQLYKDVKQIALSNENLTKTDE